MEPFNNLESSINYDPNKQPSQENNWEILLGINWFSRIGIAALLLGLALALQHTFPMWQFILTPEVKIIASGLLSLLMFFGGQKLYQNYSLFGRILQGGGLSLGYLTLFAMFFIPEVQLIQEPTIGWILLSIYTGFMIWLSTRLNSISVAAISLSLGFYTAWFSGAQFTSLSSAFLLSTAAVIINKQKPDWKLLPVLALLGSILNIIIWSLSTGFFRHATIIDGVPSILVNPEFDIKLSLWATYLLFNLSNILPLNQTTTPSTSSNIINSAGFYLIYKVMFGNFIMDGLLELLLTSFHVIQVIIGRRVNTINNTKKQDVYVKSNILMGITFAVFAIFAYFNAQLQVPALALLSLGLGYLAHREKQSLLYKGFSAFILQLSFICLLCFNWSNQSGFSLIAIVSSLVVITAILEATTFKHLDNVIKIGAGILCFFVLLCAFFTSLSSQWIVLSFLLTGFAFMSSGFITKQKKYRMIGLIWLALSLGHFIFIDLITMETIYKIISLISIGLTMLAGSFAYNKLASDK